MVSALPWDGAGYILPCQDTWLPFGTLCHGMDGAPALGILLTLVDCLPYPWLGQFMEDMAGTDLPMPG
jgi:hypothetical protein